MSSWPCELLIHADVVEGERNISGIANLLKKGEGSLGVVQRRVKLALSLVDTADVVEGERNISGIAYLLSEGEGSLVVVQRRVKLTL